MHPAASNRALDVSGNIRRTVNAGELEWDLFTSNRRSTFVLQTAVQRDHGDTRSGVRSRFAEHQIGNLPALFLERPVLGDNADERLAREDSRGQSFLDVWAIRGSPAGSRGFSVDTTFRQQI